MRVFHVEDLAEGGACSSAYAWRDSWRHLLAHAIGLQLVPALAHRQFSLRISAAWMCRQVVPDYYVCPCYCSTGKHDVLINVCYLVSCYL
jgi:hypothetical protein